MWTSAMPTSCRGRTSSSLAVWKRNVAGGREVVSSGWSCSHCVISSSGRPSCSYSSLSVSVPHGLRTPEICSRRGGVIGISGWRSWEKPTERRVVAAAGAEKIELQKDVSVTPDPKEAKIARRAADWRKADKIKETGAVHQGRIDACNSGGLLVRINSLQGFLPFSQMNLARLPKDGSKTFADIGKELVGGMISVKVIEVIEEDRRLIVSEKQAVLSDSMQQIKEGSIYEGKVNAVTDFGAFVDLQFPDGSYPVSGLVHMSELSWDPVYDPRDIIEEGQSVLVKVVLVDRERSRIALSIKQLQADPLLETLDTLMPVDSQEDLRYPVSVESEAELIGTSLPGLEQICAEMLEENGITGVTLGRQALEKRVVSQDLELWLSNAPGEGGKFTLLARAGRQVQEVFLETGLDRDGIKAALQRVTDRVP